MLSLPASPNWPHPRPRPPPSPAFRLWRNASPQFAIGDELRVETLVSLARSSPLLTGLSFRAVHWTPLNSAPSPNREGSGFVGNMLHKKNFTQTHKRPRQTQKAPHQPHKRPRPKTKSPSQPHKRPRPKTKSPHQNHKKAPPPQRPKPHHPMKCEKGAWRSHVPFSHFGGGWGDWSPHKKKLGRRYRIEIMIK